MKIYFSSNVLGLFYITLSDKTRSSKEWKREESGGCVGEVISRSTGP